VISAFRLKWANSKLYLVKIARKMPTRHYDYKPTDHQMTFKEQLLHIRENMLWLSHEYMVGDTAYEDTTQPLEVNKEATIKLLGSAFDTVDSIVNRVKKENLRDTVDFFRSQNQVPDAQHPPRPCHPSQRADHCLPEFERY
jgi:4-hydroxyphenylpyruvate dioxygenase-like putative hemolysin